LRIQLVAVGRLKAGPERELAERYRTRAAALGRGIGILGPDLGELAESRRRRTEERQAEEEEGIRARAGQALIAVLDETAPSIASEDFARRLVDLRDRGGDVAFVVGGPDGLAPGLRHGSQWALSFGRLTLPHQLVRVLVLEQIYRAFTIIAGHPYHRAGTGES
jgi:23S rRNA (pseudouridine1915-N3)-methyltransferase